MFGHLQRTIMSGIYIVISYYIPLNESLDSIGVTALGQRSKSDAANFGRTNLCTDRIIFLKSICLASSVSWVRIPPEQLFFSFLRKKSCSS